MLTLFGCVALGSSFSRRGFAVAVAHVLLAALGSAPVEAQVPGLSSFSIGVLGSQQWVAEPGDRAHSGNGRGIRFGFQVAPPLAVEWKVRAAEQRHANVSADYRIWEVAAGLRYEVRSGLRRVIPYADGYGLLQVSGMDRAGVTPGPEAGGYGGGIGAGIRVGLLTGIWLDLGADLASTWFRVGRVENGDWIRLGDAGVRTVTRRITAGASWYP